MHLRPQKFHPVHVQRLAAGIFLTHEDLTFHSHKRRHGGRGHAVLAGPRLRDHSGLSHLLCQQHLPQHVIDLVGTGMVQVFPFQIDLRPAQIFRHMGRIVKPRRPAGIFIQ